MPYHCSNDSAERESMKVGMHKRAVDSYERDTCLGANRIAYACSFTLLYRKSSSSSSFLFFRSLLLLSGLTIITIFSPLQRRMMKKIRFHFILFFYFVHRSSFFLYTYRLESCEQFLAKVQLLQAEYESYVTLIR